MFTPKTNFMTDYEEYANILFKDGVRPEQFMPATDDQGRDIGQSRYNERVKRELRRLWSNADYENSRVSFTDLAKNQVPGK